MRGAPGDGHGVLAVTLPLFVGALIVLTAAFVTTGSRARRAVGLTLALTSMGLPWLAPGEHSVLRALYGLVATVGCARVGDLCRGEWSTWRRLQHVASPIDSRTLVRGRPRIKAARLLAGLVWFALGLTAGVSLYSHAVTFTATYWAFRWAAGA